MELNLFQNKKKNKSFINQFIKELKNNTSSRNRAKQENSKLKEEFSNEEEVTNEYNLYEKKKIFLDNKTRTGNSLVWVMDKNSVYISENGDGGPTAINEINLPKGVEVNQVYEQENEKYIYNKEITTELLDINCRK